MIFGKLEIVPNAIETHNDTYILTNITTISARRPFLGAGCAIAVLVSGFGVAFVDLLYPGELASIAVSVGFWLGQLQLLSRDLRGSELGVAIWGGYRHLNRKRREIAKAINQVHGRDEA